MPPEIRRLAQEYMHDAQEIRLNEDEISLDTIDQSYLVVREKEKFDHLRKFVEKTDSKQTIVFTATKQRAQRLLDDLRKHGFKATTIHGDLSQRQRDNAIYRFKKGIDNILVATDIAARGIDVPAVGHVINYDVPAETLMYFHRIGRTARAGGTGRAISLVSDDRIEDFSRIINKTEQPIRRLNEEMGIAVPPPRQQYQARRRNNYSYRPGFQRRGSYPADKNYSHSREDSNTSRHRDSYDNKRSTRYGFRSNRRARWS
jgi:ATP-dependent RNA helicase DeaD